MMVEIVGGIFDMGATTEQGLASDDEYPVHIVAVDNYYIIEDTSLLIHNS